MRRGARFQGVVQDSGRVSLLHAPSGRFLLWCTVEDGIRAYSVEVRRWKKLVSQEKVACSGLRKKVGGDESEVSGESLAKRGPSVEVCPDYVLDMRIIYFL